MLGTTGKNLIYLDKAFCGISTPMFVYNQGARKVIFTACHSGKLKLSFQLAQKTF